MVYSESRKTAETNIVNLGGVDSDGRAGMKHGDAECGAGLLECGSVCLNWEWGHRIRSGRPVPTGAVTEGSDVVGVFATAKLATGNWSQRFSNVQKVHQLQRLLCLSRSADKDDLLPVGWREEFDVTFVRNPVKVLGLLQSQSFDGVFVCADSFREVLGLSELIRDSQILKNLPDAVALLDRDQKIIWWNQKMADWIGLDELSGKGMIDCLSDATLIGADDDPVRTAAMIGRQSITRIKDKAGRYFDLIVSPVLNRGGRTDQLIVVLRDITSESLQTQKMELIHAAGVELANLTPEEIFQMDVQQRIDLLKSNILHYTQEVMNYGYFEIRLIDGKSAELQVLLSVGINSERAQQPLYVSTKGQGVTGFVAATGRSYYCPDTSKDPLYLDGLVGAGSCLVVPLIVHEHVIGTLNVESPEVDAFSRSDRQFLEIFSRDIANSLNTLELLAAQGANSAQQSIQAIHGAVALPIDEILNEACLLLEQFTHDGEVEQRLRSILNNTREVKRVIQKVGERLVSSAAVPECMQLPPRPTLIGKRVLVIDRESQVRDSAHQLLERYGLDVETAHCGHEAITMIRNLDRDQLYDCVIAEEKMEDMSGRLLLMAIQPIYQQTSPPLVFLRPSGIWDPDHVMVESRKIGLRADAQLVKPLRPEQTLNMIERMVQENQRQDEVG